MGSGRLLGLFGILAYVLFTLLPDSATNVVQWPWVIIWQAGLLSLVCAGLINLWRRDMPFFLLGNKLDWAIALYFISLCLSTIFAPFSSQALWYSLISFAFLVTVYVANNYLRKSRQLEGLLTFQGILSVVFIIESLAVWATQVLLPELSRINELRNIGVTLNFDFSRIDLRNAAPIGHQNYVAGFLMLAIPLLVSLAVSQTSIWRIIWIIGSLLGLVDLYTTSSRGGFLGLASVAIAFLIVSIVRSSKYRWQAIGVGVVVLVAIAGLAFSNNRLLSLLSGVLLGQGGGELLFRAVTIATGLSMGWQHLPFGVGPGNVPMHYQQYRPHWAEREAEMVYQLHSTPAQLWAELGILGVIATLVTIAILAILFLRLHTCRSWLANAKEQIFTYGLFGGLLAYGVMSLTDYQLDVLAISGFLVISFASIAYLGQQHTKSLIVLGNYENVRSWLGVVAIAYVCAGLTWLIPVDMAWQFSSLGFNALTKQDYEKFSQNLEKAYALANWESYYPYQLGWNLANLGVQGSNPRKAMELQQKGLDWLQKGIQANPYQEFGYNSAAWISLNKQDFLQAEQFFKKALELVPGKRSLQFGLGMSLLQQNKTEAGINAIASEAFNDPLFLTSPMWNAPQLQSIYKQVVQKLENMYGDSIYTKPLPKSVRAAVRWWIGAPGAIVEMANSNSPIASGIAAVTQNKQQQLEVILRSPQAPWEMAIAAWLKPAQRQELIERAYATANGTIPNEDSQVITKAMLERMNQSPNFDAWARSPLPSNSPLILRYRRQRSGFNVLSRHMDGPDPQDFFPVQENAIISTFFSDLFKGG